MNVDNDCFGCALQGACKEQLDACKADPECGVSTTPTGFYKCLEDCKSKCAADDACFSMCIGSDQMTPPAGTCIGDHPGGSMEYTAIISCVVCVECPVSCDAASMCM